MVELLLSFLGDDLSSVLFPAFAFLSGVLLIVFMAFHSKSNGKSVSSPYYICAFLLPLVTAIIYFSFCRRERKKADEGVERSLGKKKSVFSFVFGLLFCLSYITTIIFGGYLANDIANYESFAQEMENNRQNTESAERIKLENENGQFVYYDIKGNEYTQSLMVKIYNENGTAYDYACFQDFDKDGGEISKGYYVDGSGEKLDAEFCFVDENGYMVYRKDLQCEEKLEDGMYYFECPYTDEKGNSFYPATYASWNGEGELIVQ